MTTHMIEEEVTMTMTMSMKMMIEMAISPLKMTDTGMMRITVDTVRIVTIMTITMTIIIGTRGQIIIDHCYYALCLFLN